MWFLGLCLFHVVFFRRFYFGNPYYYATSSALDIQFSASRLLGENLRKGVLVPQDPYFYPRISGIPFLSNFYPPHMIQAWLGSFLSLDHAWILFCWTMMLHYLFASIGAYLLFSGFGPYIAFFGAMTLTHFGYAVKQNSCINYTIGWIPWMFLAADHHNSLLFGISTAMMTLSGYWPLAIHGVGFGAVYWLSRGLSGLLLAGVLCAALASPQLVLSAKYLKRSIRTKKTHEDKTSIGNLKLGAVFRAWLPPGRKVTDGVFHTEATAYIGLLGLLAALFSHSWHQWVFLVLVCLLAMGKYTPLFRWFSPILFRTPSRFCYWIALCLSFMAIAGLANLHPTTTVIRIAIVLQAFDLCINTSSLWPMEPYTERWEKPSRAFNTPLLRYLTGNPGRVSGLPFPGKQGHVNHIHTLGYNGGSQLTWMTRFREDPNPNGSGAHDWFALNQDGEKLDDYGVKYAYTYRPLKGKWKKTRVPHLYRNNLAKHPPSWQEMEETWR